MDVTYDRSANCNACHGKTYLSAHVLLFDVFASGMSIQRGHRSATTYINANPTSGQ